MTGFLFVLGFAAVIMIVVAIPLSAGIGDEIERGHISGKQGMQVILAAWGVVAFLILLTCFKYKLDKRHEARKQPLNACVTHVQSIA